MSAPETSDQGNMVSQRQGEWVLVPRARLRDDWDMLARFVTEPGAKKPKLALVCDALNDIRNMLAAPPAEPRADEGGVSGAERESSASPAHPMGEGQAGDGALYYAKGREVWKRPVATARPGGKSVALGFKVCAVADVVGEEGAATVAAMLTMAERYEERGAAREPTGCPLPGACACPAESDLSGRQGSEANTSEGTLPPAEQITQPSHDDEGLIERLIVELLDGFHDGQRERKARDIVQKIVGPAISRLKGELEEARYVKARYDRETIPELAGTAQEHFAGRLKAEAEVKELRSGLKPFAEADVFASDVPNNAEVQIAEMDDGSQAPTVAVGHFRKARSLLSPAQEGLSSARASRDARSSTRPEGQSVDGGEG